MYAALTSTSCDLMVTCDCLAHLERDEKDGCRYDSLWTLAIKHLREMKSVKTSKDFS